MRTLDQLDLDSKKYIIFDMDGTLIDSVGVWNATDKKLVEEFSDNTISLEAAQFERDTFLHNNQSSDSYLAYCAHLIDKYDFRMRDPERLLQIRWDKSGELLEKDMDFKPDAPELITKLKAQGFTVALATMTTQVQLDIYSQKNQKMLTQMNINDAFDLITRKEDVKNKKPHPEIYNLIMKHYATTPDECLIFEDSYAGVLAAKNAGVEVVNIYDKYSDIDRNKIDAIADYRIADFRQFIDLLNNGSLNG